MEINVLKDVFTVETMNVGDVMKRMDSNGLKMKMEKEPVLHVKEKLLIGMKSLKPMLVRNVVEIMKNLNITTILNAEKLRTVKVLELHIIPQENVLIAQKDVKNVVQLTVVTNALKDSDFMIINAKNVQKDVKPVKEPKTSVSLV